MYVDFLKTFVFAGTIWAQNIITLICENDFTETDYPNNLEKMPWLEYREGRSDYSLRPSPRFFATHLTPTLMPPALKNKKAKLSIYTHKLTNYLSNNVLFLLSQIISEPHGLLIFDMTDCVCDQKSKRQRGIIFSL